jgi:hypothetical protein
MDMGYKPAPAMRDIEKQKHSSLRELFPVKIKNCKSRSNLYLQAKGIQKCIKTILLLLQIQIASKINAAYFLLFEKFIAMTFFLRSLTSAGEFAARAESSPPLARACSSCRETVMDTGYKPAPAIC